MQRSILQFVSTADIGERSPELKMKESFSTFRSQPPTLAKGLQSKSVSNVGGWMGVSTADIGERSPEFLKKWDVARVDLVSTADIGERSPEH